MRKGVMRVMGRAGALVLLGMLLAGPATSRLWALGEKSQEAFLRMRTVIFYDTKFSGRKFKVGDEMTVTGKFQLLPIWPKEIAFTGISWLNFFVPGPQFLRVGSWINNRFMSCSQLLELGGTYEYKTITRARYPGHWPVGVMLSMKDAGPLIGPSIYVDVEGSHAGFTNPIKTLVGTTVDLEDYGVNRMLMWTLVTTLIGVAWLGFWLGRPFVSRLGIVAAGRAKELISGADKTVAVIFALGTIGLIAIANAMTAAQFPHTIPIQETIIKNEPLPPEPTHVEAKVLDATYDVPSRTLSFRLEVHNTGDRPLVLKEFTTANVRFFNEQVPGNVWNPDFPEVYGGPMKITPSEPVAPGETKVLEVVLASAEWENQRLTMYHETTNRFGGLLFFSDPSGARSIIAVADQLVIPRFGATQM
ncbi:Particulate methane monooxygenase subunit B [Methylacidimicrobium sp. AP8]|uniref:bacterial ammonia monooxygenase, subunit AmoB n=1 Tax=Methylacidimicrobium sp. AP8 TaxID=2730359 RepID=UPI0018C0A906|nr:bacterial ammonia monooxygenase, subunit AmoB [Methylacidimicrobium sp. AP8]CAB4243236.1 Particulate methane monooxygenase subunit B [Methylacidimicrobium sp. AP8]